jgi:prevent-host-death family protein
MVTVGTFHAKTHLSELLECVAKGEKVVITKRGKPVAMLVPPETGEARDIGTVVKEMLAARDADGPSLGPGLSVRQLIDEGRRY